MEDLSSLKRKVKLYKDILNNTENYRKDWNDRLRDEIVSTLELMIAETEMEATVEVKKDLENLEAIVCSLGEGKSGIFQKVNDELNRPLIKHMGSLIYQQLFNGKIIVIITYPMIENYGEPRPPKTVAIYRPEELKEPFFVRHMEDFIKEITRWEDYDDDDNGPTQKIGFNLEIPDTDMQN